MSPGEQAIVWRGVLAATLAGCAATQDGSGRDASPDAARVDAIAPARDVLPGPFDRGTGSADVDDLDSTEASPGDVDDPPADASPSGERCANEVDIAREGERIEGGLRIPIDLRRGRPPPFDEATPPTFRSGFASRVLAFVAPSDGVFGVEVTVMTVRQQSPLEIRVARVTQCDPLRLQGAVPFPFDAERIRDGVGHRFRLRRAETLRVVVTAPLPLAVLVVSVRRMVDRAVGDRCTALDACAAGSRCRAGRCVASSYSAPECDTPGARCSDGSVCTDFNGLLFCSFIPTDGEYCRDRCGPGRVCGRDPSRCVRPGDEGSPCALESPCREGLRCFDDGRCRRVAREGERCPFPTVCDEGLRCVGFYDQAPRCVGPGDLGGACRSESDRCAADLGCNARGECVGPVGLRGRCPSAGYGPPAFCRDGFCSAEGCGENGSRCGICFAPSEARGQSCLAPPNAPCPAGLACVGDRCRALLEPGTRCEPRDSGTACRDGACVGGACVVTSGRRGEACSPPIAPCVSDADYCSLRGVCEARLPARSQCAPLFTPPCEAGYACSGPLLGVGACLESPTRSRSCGEDGACASGRRCIEGRCVTPGFCDRAPDALGPIPCGDGRYCAMRGALPECVPAGADGARCRVGEPRCDVGLSCSAWEVCRPASSGGPCVLEAFDVCPGGTACLPDPGLSRRDVCVPDGDLGGRCRQPLRRADACDAGLACHVQTGICRRSSEGGGCADAPGSTACPEGSACPSIPAEACIPDGARLGRCRPYAPHCDAGAICDETRWVCARAAAEGESCDGRSNARCADGLACVEGRCVRRGPAGAQCVAGAPESCAEGLSCDWLLPIPRCVAVGGASQPCRADRTCEAGLTCSSSRCVPLAGLGEPCSTDTRVGPICREGRCGDGRCRRYGEIEGRCDRDLDCPEGSRCVDSGGPTSSRSLVCRRTVPRDGDCSVGPCPQGQRCRGRCEDDAPEGALDGPCRLAAVPRCDGALRCDFFRGTCVREPP